MPPSSNAVAAEVEWFYEDLQDLLELTPPKDVPFIIGDWNAKSSGPSVQFSHSVVSDSFRPHESQHTRPPCPSPTPGVYSNSWALGSIIMNKASGGDGIPVELFQILKDDAVKVLHLLCQQIW